MRPAALLLLSLLLAACSASLPQAGRTGVFNCDGGYRLVTRDQGDKHWLYLPTGEERAQLVTSAAGARYVAGAVSFTPHGDGGRLEIGGERSRRCVEDSQAMLWEDARFRGVLFRAVGNDPAWLLEIDRNQFVFAADYGRRVLSFPANPPRTLDRSAMTSYASLNETSRIEVLLEPGDCYDGRSGERFKTRVTLTLDNEPTRYGCGRFLN